MAGSLFQRLRDRAGKAERRAADIAIIEVDVALLHSQLNEDVARLHSRLDHLALEIQSGHQRDESALLVIQGQQAAISQLEKLNKAKSREIKGMAKWVVLASLGFFSLFTRYSVSYEEAKFVVKPDPAAGLIIPALYATAIIAVVTGNDEKIGGILSKVGMR